MLAIVTCFESTIEDKCVGLYRSLSRYASHPSGLRIFAVCPRRGLAPSALAIDEAARAGVEYIEAPLNTEFADYPLANKPLSCWHVASKICTADAYLFLDSDTLFLNRTDFGMHAASHVAMRGVDVQNVGVTSFDEPNGSYWKTMYDYLGVRPERRITPSTGGPSIFEYYNSGYIYVRDASLFEVWLALMTHLLRSKRYPDRGVFYVEQSALSASITASGTHVDPLPNDLNYPLHLHNKMSPRTRIDDIASTRHVHYHDIFVQPANRASRLKEVGFAGKAAEVLHLLDWNCAVPA